MPTPSRRRLRRLPTSTLLVPAALALLALPACNPKELVSCDAPGGRTVITISPDWLADNRQIVTAAEDAVTSTAGRQGTLVVLVRKPDSPDQVDTVDLGADAHQGNFRSEAKNPTACRDDAAEFAEASMRSISLALGERPPGRPSSYGTDHLSLLEQSISIARSSGAKGPREVYLITGGGVQQSDRVDLVASDVTVETGFALGKGAPLRVDVSGISIVVKGASVLNDVTPPPAPAFKSGVFEFWKGFCDGVNAVKGAHCTSTGELS